MSEVTVTRLALGSRPAQAYCLQVDDREVRLSLPEGSTRILLFRAEPYGEEGFGFTVRTNSGWLSCGLLRTALSVCLMGDGERVLMRVRSEGNLLRVEEPCRT